MSGMKASGNRPRIGLNAQLYSSRLSYRSAGVSHYILALLTSLPQVDPNIDYVAFLNDPAASFAGWQTVRTHLPESQPWRRILWEQTSQPRLARQERLDLLHEPVYVGPWQAPCPIVVTIHDMSYFIYPELFQPAKRKYLQTMTRYTAQHAAAIICDSESTRRDVLRILAVSADRVHTVHLGVDPEMQPLPRQLVAEFKREHQLPEHFILFVGTLEPRKNLPVLVQAFAWLRQHSRLNHHLVIGGGKGWYYQTLEQQVEKLGLRDQIHFPGFIPQAELPLWYNSADLFVYPSLYEGFGLPPLEAMACGVPVITTNVSSLPEAVGAGAILVSPDEPVSLGQEMQRLLSDPSASTELCDRGIAQAKLFSWSNTARQTVNVYHAILGNRKVNES
jgi:glycosyltransferase involved in cell wall biosynthesis